MRRRDQEDHQATRRAGKASRRPRGICLAAAVAARLTTWPPVSRSRARRQRWRVPAREDGGGGDVRCPGATSWLPNHERERRDAPPLLSVLVQVVAKVWKFQPSNLSFLIHISGKVLCLTIHSLILQLWKSYRKLPFDCLWRLHPLPPPPPPPGPSPLWEY